MKTRSVSPIRQHPSGGRVRIPPPAGTTSPPPSTTDPPKKPFEAKRKNNNDQAGVVQPVNTKPTRHNPKAVNEWEAPRM